MTSLRAVWLPLASFVVASALSMAALCAQNVDQPSPFSADSASEDNSIPSLTAAIQANPGEAVLYRKRGYAYLSNNRFDDALVDLNQSITLDPQDPDSYRLRGFCYLRKGDYDNAIKNYSKTIELNPNSAIAYARRGQSEALEGNRNNAVNDLNKAMELSTVGTQARNTSAVVALTWRAMGNPQKAQEALDKGTQATSQNPAAFD